MLAKLGALGVLALVVAGWIPASAAAAPAPGKHVCVIHSLPSFVEAGEKETDSSLADIVEVECEPVYSGAEVEISDTELYSRCKGNLLWSEIVPFEPTKGPSIKVKLDDDGSAIAVLFGGPGCAAGETLLVADLEAGPHTTVHTEFEVIAPKPTKPGVYAEPPKQVETDFSSDVATIVHIEFPAGFAEQYVNVKTSLYSHCAEAPHLIWVGPDGKIEAVETNTLEHLQLDDDGNAFVVLLGGESCASGPALIETSLEEAPNTTYFTYFEVEPPRPTVNEATYTIEKLQRLGTEGEYTAAELTGKVGETIHYEIVVKNTGELPLKFSKFSDPGCTNIKGGAEELQPGASATWTCEEKITEHRTYTNVAKIEANEGAGPMESNEVVVKVNEPLLSIEKLQKLTGAYTKAELSGAIGETVFYEIIAKNEGNVTLKLSNFSDTKCTNLIVGATELKPGESTTWLCEHKLTQTGRYVNDASVEANEGVGKKTSNEVAVKVGGAKTKEVEEKPLFTIRKLQMVKGSGKPFTTSTLFVKSGETVLYELIVKNTGVIPLKLSKLTDTKCENIKGGATELLPGEETTFTCEHTVVNHGSWYNFGTITGTTPGGKSVTHTSNEVIVYDP